MIQFDHRNMSTIERDLLQKSIAKYQPIRKALGVVFIAILFLQIAELEMYILSNVMSLDTKWLTPTGIGLSILLGIVAYFVNAKKRDFRNNQKEDLEAGTVCVVNFTVSEAIKLIPCDPDNIEETWYLFQIEETKTLTLQGWYVLDYDQGEQLSGHHIEVVKTPKSQTILDFKIKGDPIRFSLIYKHNVTIEDLIDGEILNLSLESIKEKINQREGFTQSPASTVSINSKETISNP